MSQGERFRGDGAASESTEPPSVEVVDAVAALADEDPHELEPLYSVVDPDALDAIFTDPATPGVHRAGRVEFTYCGFEVVVSCDGSSTSVSVY